MSEARSFRCHACGGYIAVTTGAALIPCPYCGRTVAVPEALRRELGGYASTVKVEAGTAGAERHAAADERALQRSQRAFDWRWWAIYTVAAFLVMGLALLLGDSPLGKSLGFIAPILLIGILVAATVLRPALRAQRHAEPLPSPTLRPLPCPSCGAPHAFVAGNISERCRHCGAPLAPTRAVAAEGLQATRAMLMRARLSHYRAQRTDWSLFAGKARSFSLLPTLGPVGAMLLISIGITLSAIRTGDTKGLIPVWFISLLLVFATVYTALNYRRTTQGWLNALATMLVQFRGQVAEPLVWLNAFWAGPTSYELVRGGWYYRAVELMPLGYRVLFVTNPSGLKGQSAYITALLAAWLPGISDQETPDFSRWEAQLQDPNIRARYERLIDAGFEVEPTVAGLVVSAREKRLGYFQRHPDHAAVLLPPVIEDLARFAAAIGAQPITEPFPP